MFHFRWIGDMMKQQLGSLKPVQLSELEAEFEKVEGKAKPERLLRSQQVWYLSQIFVNWTFLIGWVHFAVLIPGVFLYPSGQVNDFWKVDQELSTKYVASSSELIKEKLPRVTPHHHEIPCIESEK